MSTVLPEGHLNSAEAPNRSLKKSLHCELQDNRWFSMRHRHSTLDQGWEMYKGAFNLYCECDTTFLIQFEDQEGRDLVLEENPWSLNGAFMMVKSHRPLTIPPAFKIKRTPSWVQIHGMPKEFLSPQKVVWVGSVAGVVRLIDWDEKGTDAVRVRVMIRPDEPLVAGVYLLRGNGEKTWVGFRYERVCVLCHKCGVIGHVKRDCDLSEEEINGLVESKFGETMVRMGLDAEMKEKDQVDHTAASDRDIASFLVRLHGASNKLHTISVGEKLNYPLPGKYMGLELEREAVYDDETHGVGFRCMWMSLFC